MSRSYSRHITEGDFRVHAEDRGLYGVYRGGPPGLQIGKIERNSEGYWYSTLFGRLHGPYSTLKFAISQLRFDAP